MSINEIFYSGTAADSESWKQLGLKSLHVKELTVNGHALIFDKADATVQVNTYDGANNLVTADVFSINIHIVLVGHIAILTIGAFGPYVSPGVFNYFGFQLPSDFIPNTINTSLLLCSFNSAATVTKCVITSTGQVRISQDIASTNFAMGDTFSSAQQTVTYDNSN